MAVLLLNLGFGSFSRYLRILQKALFSLTKAKNEHKKKTKNPVEYIISLPGKGTHTNEKNSLNRWQRGNLRVFKCKRGR